MVMYIGVCSFDGCIQGYDDDLVYDQCEFVVFVMYFVVVCDQLVYVVMLVFEGVYQVQQFVDGVL